MNSLDVMEILSLLKEYKMKMADHFFIQNLKLKVSVSVYFSICNKIINFIKFFIL